MSRTSSNFIEPYIFPVTLLAIVGLHTALLAYDATPFLAAWIPAGAAAFSVALAEWRFPANHSWRPARNDIKVDAAFMIVVQIALPSVFTLLAAFTLAGNLRDLDLPVRALWPSDAHHLAQLALALLTGSFIRYWLHRLAHAWRPLWRLHAVHHAPRKLYWLNVGRFHPLEKAIQFSVETLPLMVLGVDEAVLGSYFVLYATIGFFEHSNIRMRNPWLGYVLSTAELHRRHHSREPAESSCNFGNMLMIWDVLFGTRRAAAISAPGALGLTCESYPRGFLALLIAPFRASPYSRQATTRTESTLLSIPPGKLSESPMQTEG